MSWYDYYLEEFIFVMYLNYSCYKLDIYNYKLDVEHHIKNIIESELYTRDKFYTRLSKKTLKQLKILILNIELDSLISSLLHQEHLRDLASERFVIHCSNYLDKKINLKEFNECFIELNNYNIKINEIKTSITSNKAIIYKSINSLILAY